MTAAAPDVDRPPTDTTRVFRAVFAVALLAIEFGYLLYYRALDTRDGGAAYQTADWLISYADGFVRRGLFGEVFLALAPSGSAGLWALFAVQGLLYAVVFGFAVWALARARFSWPMIALVCGPAALGFFAWDPAAAFRKEVLAYVSLSLVVWALVAVRRRLIAVVLTVLSLLVFALAVFSWETSALFLPAFLYLLVRRGDDLGLSLLFRRVLAGAFLLVGGTGLALGTLFHGSVATAQAICDVVREHGFTRADLCSGAIDAIGWTSQYTLDSVTASFPLYVGYLPLALLAIIPVLTTPWIRRNWGWALLIALAFLPLFVIVTDYGRWINMIVMALVFCIAAGPIQNTFSRAWTWLTVILYTTLWGLPHWLPADFAQPWPWLGLAKVIGSTLIDTVARFVG
ncbi:MAG: hypothetical protein KF761_10340 [Salinibacterium sp.]|nr:hypothetical protein [Salinibacterium sp.]